MQSAAIRKCSSTSGESTQVIDLAGKLAIPGFIEGHGHLTGLGSAPRMSLNLMTVKNWDQVVSMVARVCDASTAGRLDPRVRLAPGEMG